MAFNLSQISYINEIRKIKLAAGVKRDYGD
jgi:hypothetical protein